MEPLWRLAQTRLRLTIHPGFVAATPTLEGFKDRYLFARHEKTSELTTLFYEQVERWKKDTQHWSSITKMIAHPSYLRVIGLARQSTGTEIERLLLQELEDEPDHWFEALMAITGEDPVLPEDDFDQSVEAWLAWGRERGIISQ
jgi:hypothetical protein